MKSKKKEDNTDKRDSKKNSSDDDAGAKGEDRNADEPKHFERPDNLRRRSEWFQKRTGGR